MTNPRVLSLEENERERYIVISRILIRIADNVLRNPTEPLYRRLRITNPTVLKTMMPAIGAIECLFEMGYEEGGDCLIFPQNASLDRMKNIRNEIFTRRQIYLSKKIGKDEKPGNKCLAETSNQGTTAADKSSSSLQDNSKPKHEETFLNELWKRSKFVMQYEDEVLQKEALKILPVGEFTANAIKKMRNIQKKMMKGQTHSPLDVDIAELMLAELMSWFKNSFFSWVDTPQCQTCKNQTVYSFQRFQEGTKVEVYVCDKCRTYIPFHRYNDVSKLLKTRQGRCGEWANCFTFFCRVLGWDARYVFDQTDHVWTEVYSHTSKRWLHCDPCENVIDNPLMYELGWNKKLTYVIAFSCEDVQDVTWRYTTKYKEVLARRKECSESDLIAVIMQIRESLQDKFSETRKQYLERRMVLELVDFLTPQVPHKEGYEGRTSGSLAWRLARGETDSDGEESPIAPFIWEPTPAEVKQREVRISYSAARDLYVRGNGADEGLQHWEKGVYECKSVFRKEEKDWKMVYLARREGSSTGTVIWKFDCGDNKVCVEKIKIRCSVTLYESGDVNLILCNEKCCLMIPPGVDNVFETSEFDGSTTFTLSAELSGGNGDNAWQHAQLFRQGADDADTYPLEIAVTLRPLVPA